MNIPLLDPTKRWECPSCGLQKVTKDPRPTTPMHPCRGQSGLDVPLVEVHGLEFKKHSARHVVLEREDYVGSETGVRRDGDGRVVMAVHTERSDGSNDCVVFAAAATARST